MNEIRKMIGINMRRQIANPRFYVGLAITMVAVMFNFGGLTDFLSEYGMHVQVVELFVFTTSDRFSQWMLVFSFLILVGDAPFLHEGMDVVIMRSNKKRWLIAQVLYMAIIIFLWLVFLEVCLLLTQIGYISWENEWSDYIRMVTSLQYAGESVGMLVQVSKLPLTQGSPFLMFAAAFLYSMLLYVYFGAWGMMLNLLTGRSYASFIVVCFLALRYALNHFFYNSKLVLFSPADLVDLTVYSIEFYQLIYTILFFAVQILVLYFVTNYILKKSDICKLS